ATFATLPSFANYLNAAINPNPGALRINDASFTAPPPGSEWGAQALYSFAPAWQAAIGVFNNNPESAAGSNHGRDWTLHEGNGGGQNVNPLPLFAAAGATCQGPFRERPNDVASIGWYYGRLSDRIEPPATYSQALEVSYQYTISAAINVVVDAQYLFRLNGYPSRGTTVLGTQIAVTFKHCRQYADFPGI